MITTRKLAATNTKGARVSATCQGQRVEMPWDYSLDGWEAHAPAARKLAERITGRPTEVRYIGSTNTTYMFKIVK